MDASYHRHVISDEVWALLEPHLPGQRGQWGGIAEDNRRFINAVFCAPVRLGATCPLITGSGTRFTVVFLAGAKREYGKTA